VAVAKLTGLMMRSNTLAATGVGGVEDLSRLDGTFWLRISFMHSK